MRVFVSSTARDLSGHRAIAGQVIQQLGWQPVLFMEHQSVPTGPSVRACQEQVANCEQLLLIVGHRCGWIPSRAHGGSGAMSITEIELLTWTEVQRRRGSTIRHPLIMMASDPSPNEAGERSEDELHRSCQFMFRQRLRSSGLLIHEFAMPGDGGESSGMQAYTATLTTLVSKWNVANAAENVRRARTGAWILGALGVALGIGLASSSEADQEAPW